MARIGRSGPRTTIFSWPRPSSGRRPGAARSGAARPARRRRAPPARRRPRTSPPPPLPVDKAPEDVIVAAWAEPSRLPPAGGQTQILVRLQKRGGVPFPGVQVRLRTSAGSLTPAARCW